MGAARAWVGWWVLLAALYLALADTPPLPELVTGAVIAALGATGAVNVRRRRAALPRADWRWAGAALRPLAGLVTDLPPVVHALVSRGMLRRPGTGALVEVPFHAVGGSRRDAAQRALTQALGSLAPNTVVIDVDLERRVLLAHQLVATDDPAADATPLGP